VAPWEAVGERLSESREVFRVVPIVIVMALILVLAALVVAFVAYPHRGEDLPGVPWLGDAMARAADAVPTLEVEYETEDAERRR
jgi:hypothetical protein